MGTTLAQSLESDGAAVMGRYAIEGECGGANRNAPFRHSRHYSTHLFARMQLIASHFFLHIIESSGVQGCA